MGVAHWPLGLVGKKNFFKVFIDKAHSSALVAHGKTVRVSRSVFFEVIAGKERQLYLQVLIFVNKFYLLFYQQPEMGILKNICSKQV